MTSNYNSSYVTSIINSRAMLGGCVCTSSGGGGGGVAGVTSINNEAGAITISGEGGITVTNVGPAFIISNTGSLGYNWSENPATEQVKIAGNDISGIVSFNGLDVSFNSSSNTLGIGNDVLNINNGSNVVAFGNGAGYGNQGNNSIFLGSNPSISISNVDTNRFIAYSTNATLPFMYGDTGNNKLSIGTSNLSANLTVSGSLFASGALYDSTYSTGTVGQVLTSTVTGTAWAPAVDNTSNWSLFPAIDFVKINGFDISGIASFNNISASFNSNSNIVGIGNNILGGNVGSNVVAFGNNAGFGNQGNNSIFLGSNPNISITNADANRFIAYSTDATRPFMYGDTLSNKLSIGTSNLSANLTVSGSLFASGALYDSTYSTGTVGQVLTTTGSSTLWNTPAMNFAPLFASFLSMSTQNSVVSPASVPITYSERTIGTINLSGSIPSSQIVIPVAGTYKVVFSAQCDSLSGTHELEIFPVIGGVSVPKSNTRIQLAANSETCLTVEYILDFTANQILQFYMTGDNTGARIIALTRGGGTSIVIPDIPSMIVTIIRIA